MRKFSLEKERLDKLKQRLEESNSKIALLTEESGKFLKFVQTCSAPIVMKHYGEISNFTEKAYEDLRELSKIDTETKSKLVIDPSLKPSNISMKNFIGIIEQIDPKVVCYKQYRHTENRAHSGLKTRGQVKRQRSVPRKDNLPPVKPRRMSSRPVSASKTASRQDSESYKPEEEYRVDLPKISQKNYDDLESVFAFSSEPFVLKYFIADDYWQKMNFDGRKTEFEGGLRHFATVSLPNARCILSGGCFVKDNEPSKLCFEGSFKDPTKMVKISSLSHSRYGHGSCYIMGYIYAIGGYDHKDNTEEFSTLKTCERLNLQSFRWEKAASLNQRRAFAGILSFNNKYIYAFGGYNDDKIMGTIEKYEFMTDSWGTLHFEMKTKLSKVGAVVYREKIILVGGIDSNYNMVRDVVKFDPVKQNFVAMQKMKYHRVGLQGSFVYEDYLYMFGGNNQMSCERFSFKEGRWDVFTSFTSMLKGRSRNDYDLEFASNFVI